eukprot:sb/3464023/
MNNYVLGSVVLSGASAVLYGIMRYVATFDDDNDQNEDDDDLSDYATCPLIERTRRRKSEVAVRRDDHGSCVERRRVASGDQDMIRRRRRITRTQSDGHMLSRRRVSRASSMESIPSHIEIMPAKLDLSEVSEVSQNHDVKEPVVKEPVAKEPVVKEPVVNERVVNERVVKESVVKESVVKEPRTLQRMFSDYGKSLEDQGDSGTKEQTPSVKEGRALQRMFTEYGKSLEDQPLNDLTQTKQEQTKSSNQGTLDRPKTRVPSRSSESCLQRDSTSNIQQEPSKSRLSRGHRRLSRQHSAPASRTPTSDAATAIDHRPRVSRQRSEPGVSHNVLATPEIPQTDQNFTKNQHQNRGSETPIPLENRGETDPDVSEFTSTLFVFEGEMDFTGRTSEGDLLVSDDDDPTIREEGEFSVNNEEFLERGGEEGGGKRGGAEEGGKRGGETSGGMRGGEELGKNIRVSSKQAGTLALHLLFFFILWGNFMWSFFSYSIEFYMQSRGLQVPYR